MGRFILYQLRAGVGIEAGKVWRGNSRVFSYERYAISIYTSYNQLHIEGAAKNAVKSRRDLLYILSESVR